MRTIFSFFIFFLFSSKAIAQTKEETMLWIAQKMSQNCEILAMARNGKTYRITYGKPEYEISYYKDSLGQNVFNTIVLKLNYKNEHPDYSTRLSVWLNLSDVSDCSLNTDSDIITMWTNGKKILYSYYSSGGIDGETNPDPNQQYISKLSFMIDWSQETNFYNRFRNAVSDLVNKHNKNKEPY